MGKKNKKKRGHPESAPSSVAGSQGAAEDPRHAIPEQPGPQAPAEVPPRGAPAPATAATSGVDAKPSAAIPSLTAATGPAGHATDAAAGGGTDANKDEAAGAPPPRPRVGPPGPSTASGCLVHFAWKFYGPALLFALASAILVNNPPIGDYDAAYLALSILILFARRRDDRSRAEGENPTPPGEFRSFALRLSGGALLAWLLARVLSRL